MPDTADTSYPAALQLADQRRGKLDGQQHLPSLAEVRRRQRELAGTEVQLSVGYQSVLLAELHQQLHELKVVYDQRVRAARMELDRCTELITQARDELDRAEQRLQLAQEPLTDEELLPRNSEEEHWVEPVRRYRREAGRSRRIARARASADEARSLLRQRHLERAAASRQQQVGAADPGIQAQRVIELCRRRLAEYLSALAQHHPEGRTLYPLLSIPEIPLPDWAVSIPDGAETPIPVADGTDTPVPVPDSAETPEPIDAVTGDPTLSDTGSRP